MSIEFRRRVVRIEEDWNELNALQRAREKLQCPFAERLVVIPRCKCKGGVLPQETKAALTAAQSFADLCPIVRNAKATLSFWGSRHIQVAGCFGVLPIDALVQRVLELIKQNPNFDQKERSHGKIIAPLIDQIYDASDKQVLESSWFTKMCVFLRKIPILISGFTLVGPSRKSSEIRWEWKECESETRFTSFERKGFHRIFNYYTKAQYEMYFGPVEKGHIYGGEGPGSIYWAPEDHPRQWTLDELRSEMQCTYLSLGQVIEICAANGFVDVLEEVLQNGFRGQDIRRDDYSRAVKYAAQNNHSAALRLLLQQHPEMIDPDKIVEAATLAEFYEDTVNVHLLKQLIERRTVHPR